MTIQNAILRMIRPLNLAIILLTTLLIGFALDAIIVTKADWVDLMTYTFTILLLAAGGNILNDIQDVDTDRANQKHRNQIGRVIPEFVAWTLYGTSSFIGLFMAWIFYQKLDAAFLLVFLTFSLLLIYSIFIQRLPFIGNLVVAVLCTFPILLCSIIFRPVEFLSLLEDPLSLSLASIDLPELFVIGYSIFAFALTLLREMIKDIEDAPGDKKAGFHSLPIILGIDHSRNLTLIIGLIVLILETVISIKVYQAGGHWQNLSVVLFALTVIPMMLILNQIARLKSEKDAAQISGYIKIAMLLGLSTSLFFAFL